jgi:hypothetical protein
MWNPSRVGIHKVLLKYNLTFDAQVVEKRHATLKNHISINRGPIFDFFLKFVRMDIAYWWLRGQKPICHRLSCRSEKVKAT